MKKRVADIIMKILVQNDITDCFGVVGGGAMHLNNALAKCDKIHKYFNHHEQASAMAATAYARECGRMAAVCVTSGPGGTNTLTGVMGAWEDSLPMIVISGQVRYDTTIESCNLPLRYRGLQEFDIINSVRNMTKYAVTIKDPLEIKREFQKAIDIALDGRRGPVWVEVPLNIQGDMVEENNLYKVENHYTKKIIVKDSEIEEIFTILKSSKRPCILSGSGIISSNTRDEFEKFLNKVKIPVLGGAWVPDVLYDEHYLYYGLSGNMGPRTGNFILQNADVILVLGNSLGFRQTGFNQDGFAPNAKIIMIDIDYNESKKPGLNIFKFIHSDLRYFFDKVNSDTKEIEAPKEWMEYCDKLKKRFTPYESIQNLKMLDRVSSYYFWKEFSKYEADDSIVALGNSTCDSSKLQIGVRKKNQKALSNHTCGSMGDDLPAAIGAAVSSGKEVICVTGEGSIMMNIQELQTIKQYNLPIKVVVFSNDGYAAIRNTCKNFFKGKYIGCNKESGISFPDFRKIAEAFGYSYKICNNNKELDGKLKSFFAYKGNIILEILQKFDDPVIPKVTSRMNENGVFETPKLHDMAPFLNKSELDELMIYNKSEV